MKMLLILCLVILTGCTSSSVVRVSQSLDGYQQYHLKVLPLMSSNNDIAHDDSRRAASYSVLAAAIVGANKSVYLYAFEDADYINFETSLVESMSESRNFSSVESVDENYGCTQQHEVCLKVIVVRTQVHNDAFLSVSIVGDVFLEGGAIKNRDFTIRSKGSGPFTLGQSKKGAMKDFIRQVYENIM